MLIGHDTACSPSRCRRPGRCHCPGRRLPSGLGRRLTLGTHRPRHSTCDRVRLAVAHAHRHDGRAQPADHRRDACSRVPGQHPDTGAVRWGPGRVRQLGGVLRVRRPHRVLADERAGQQAAGGGVARGDHQSRVHRPQDLPNRRRVVCAVHRHPGAGGIPGAQARLPWSWPEPGSRRGRLSLAGVHLRPAQSDQHCESRRARGRNANRAARAQSWRVRGAARHGDLSRHQGGGVHGRRGRLSLRHLLQLVDGHPHTHRAAPGGAAAGCTVDDRQQGHATDGSRLLERGVRDQLPRRRHCGGADR